MVAQDTLLVLPVQDAVHAAHTRVLYFMLWCGAVSTRSLAVPPYTLDHLYSHEVRESTTLQA